MRRANELSPAGARRRVAPAPPALSVEDPQLALQPPGGGWAGAWRLHLALAQASERLGDAAAAATAQRQAVAELERLRKQLAPGERATFDSLPEVNALVGRASLAAS